MDQKETHSDGGEQIAGRCEHSLCRYDARGLLREIEGIDGYIQRGENTVLYLLSLRLGGHGSVVRVIDFSLTRLI